MRENIALTFLGLSFIANITVYFLIPTYSDFVSSSLENPISAIIFFLFWISSGAYLFYLLFPSERIIEPKKGVEIMVANPDHFVSIVNLLDILEEEIKPMKKRYRGLLGIRIDDLIEKLSDEKASEIEETDNERHERIQKERDDRLASEERDRW